MNEARIMCLSLAFISYM